MSAVTLMQGDCCEKLNGIPAHSVNLVLADPPYGITHQAWDTVLPFEDFLEKNGKRLSQPEFLLSCYKEGIPYADAMSIWTENKQQGIWKQLDRILTENGAVILFSAGAYTKTLMDSKVIPWRYNLHYPGQFLDVIGTATPERKTSVMKLLTQAAGLNAAQALYVDDYYEALNEAAKEGFTVMTVQELMLRQYTAEQ